MSKHNRQRCVVIGLDGVPFSFLNSLMANGELPNLRKIFSNGSLRRLNSVIPTVSSVAWTSFMTGKNPGKHGIYGFVDRELNTYNTFIPTTRNIRGETLWEVLSRHGKRVVVMNVPISYPPRPVNGILVGCFLTPTLEKGVYPPSIVPTLQRLGYRIDVDAWIARKSLDEFLKELKTVLERRAEVTLHFLRNGDWDFLMMHFMETDRLHHFLWEQMQAADERYQSRCLDIYRFIDGVIGDLWAELDGDTSLVMLSDHGFCTIRQEINLNAWLRQNGWLKFRNDPPASLEEIHPDSVAYSVIPGKIYLNLEGREPQGSVRPAEYERLRDQLARQIAGLRDSESGEFAVDRVLTREEAYCGPAFAQAPDLIVLPRDGYDLKADLKKERLFERGIFTGMHTFSDAFLFFSSRTLPDRTIEMVEVMPTILQEMGIPAPDDLDAAPLAV